MQSLLFVWGCCLLGFLGEGVSNFGWFAWSMDFHQYLYEAPIFSMPVLSYLGEWVCFGVGLVFGGCFGVLILVFGVGGWVRFLSLGFRD